MTEAAGTYALLFAAGAALGAAFLYGLKYAFAYLEMVAALLA